MKKLLGIFIFFIATLSIVGSINGAYAYSLQTGPTINLTKGQIIDDSLYTFGETIDIDSNVNGDVFCAGQSVVINGNINGDVICAAQDITINGNVLGNLRVAGQSISLNGKVTKNVSVLGQSILINPGSKIGEDFSFFAQDVSLQGSVGRDLYGSGNSININGMVGRNVQIDNVDTLTVGSLAAINGNLTYGSEKQANISSSAKISGTTKQTAPVLNKYKKQSMNVNLGAMIAGFIFSILSLFIVGLVLIWFFADRVRSINQIMSKKPLMSFLVGIGGLILIPFICLVLLFTFIGIPLSLIILVLWILSLVVSRIFVATLIGSYLLNRFKSQNTYSLVLSLIVGMIVCWIVFAIPILGAILSFIAVLWGLGGIILNIYRYKVPESTQV